jgi:uncharacterized protein
MVISKTISLPFPIKRASTTWVKFTGFLRHRGPIVESGLLLAPCKSVHMLFTRHPIDVVFLTKSNRVVKTVSYLKPWRVIPPVKNAHATLKLPVGTVKTEKIRVGDTFLFHE